MLYFHKDKDGSDMFLSGKKSSNETKGEINLKEVVSVRVSLWDRVRLVIVGLSWNRVCLGRCGR